MGPDLEPFEWAIVWAHLHMQANSLNAGARQKIEQWFAASGVSVEQMHIIAEQAKQAVAAEQQSDEKGE